MRRLSAALAAGFLLLGCSSSNDGSERPLLARTVGEAGVELPAYDPSSDEPPLLTLVRQENSVSLAPFSFCWTPADGDTGICADGTPPENPQTLDGSGTISLYFPIDGFRFEARVFDTNYENSERGPEVVQVGDRWEFEPDAGQPRIIELFGFDEKSDVIVSFQVPG